VLLLLYEEWDAKMSYNITKILKVFEEWYKELQNIQEIPKDLFNKIDFGQRKIYEQICITYT